MIIKTQLLIFQGCVFYVKKDSIFDIPDKRNLILFWQRKTSEKSEVLER